jgi:hypothetical protein
VWVIVVRDVFEVIFAVVERIVVFMVRLLTRKAVHDFPVHCDFVGFTLVFKPSDCVDIFLFSFRTVVVSAKPIVVVKIE